MIHKTIIDPKAEQLITIVDIKSALGFGGRTDKDPELEIVLQTAIGEVETVGDVSLRGYNVCISYDYPKAVNTLYLQPVTAITSVKSATGEDIPYTLQFDKRKFTLDVPQPCLVEYSTQAISKEQAQPYINAVLELSMYIFNRETDIKTRNSILRPIAIR